MNSQLFGTFTLSLPFSHFQKLTTKKKRSRFGSCGSLDASLKVGSLGVPRQALTISTNYNYFHSSKQGNEPYLISKPIKADEGLQKHLLGVLEREASDEETEVRSIELHASSDCFCTFHPSRFTLLFDQLSAQSRDGTIQIRVKVVLIRISKMTTMN